MPESLILDLHRMARRLPDAALTVVAGTFFENVGEGSRHVPFAEIGQLSARELTRNPFCPWQKFKLSVTILQAASDTKVGSQSTMMKVA